MSQVKPGLFISTHNVWVYADIKVAASAAPCQNSNHHRRFTLGNGDGTGCQIPDPAKMRAPETAGDFHTLILTKMPFCSAQGVNGNLECKFTTNGDHIFAECCSDEQKSHQYLPQIKHCCNPSRNCSLLGTTPMVNVLQEWKFCNTSSFLLRPKRRNWRKASARRSIERAFRLYSLCFLSPRHRFHYRHRRYA